MSNSTSALDADRLLMQFHRWGVTRCTGSRLTRPARWVSWGGFVSMLVLSNPRARGHRVHALARMWAWQIWRRVAHGPIVISLDGGVRLRMPPWSTLAGVVAATGSHEPDEQAFLTHLLRPGDSVIDVGANIGIYALPLAGLGARVSAFEPGSSARDALRLNVELNSAEERVRIFPFALGDRDHDGALTTDLDGANHLLDATGSDARVERVRVRTLDGVIGGHPEWFEGHKVVALKIDAEGHDELVLRGAERLLEKDKPVVIVEIWDGGERIRQFLARLGYRVFRYQPDDRCLVEYPKAWSGQANFIAVPGSGDRWNQVADRLTGASPFTPAFPTVQWRLKGPALDPPSRALIRESKLPSRRSPGVPAEEGAGPSC